MRAFVPQPIHAGFLSQLQWLFPDIEWMLEGSSSAFQVNEYFSFSKLAFSHQTLDTVRLQDFDFVLGIIEETPQLAKHKLRSAKCPVIWRSYFIDVHEQMNGPVVYSAECVRQRSRVTGPTIREVRDPALWCGWRGPAERALFVATNLKEHWGRYIACGGPFLDHLRVAVPTRSVTSEGRITLDALLEEYRSCGVYVEAPSPTSITRVFSGSLIEAMFVGAPVVVRDCNEFALVVRHDHDGLVARSDKGLIEAVRAVLGDPDLAVRLGAEARRTALRLFDAATARRQWAAVFRSVGLRVEDAPS